MGDVVRIFGGRADPLERGPPKRVSHVVENIGEHVAASKKRASWKFTLGEADTIHEVTLLHSVMSMKKVVEFDGREQYMNNTMATGDWSVILLLESTNSALEVRINDIEAGDIPKYDFLIDRVPYRRMDVYRRSKAKPAPHNFAPNPGHGYQQQQQPQQLQHDSGLQKGHWGPGGNKPEPASVPPPKPVQPAAPVPPEVNLLDTSAPAVSVSAHAIVFDPFVSGAPPAAPAPTNAAADLMGLFSQPPSATTGQATPSNNVFQPQAFATAPMNRAPMAMQGMQGMQGMPSTQQAFPPQPYQQAPMMGQPPNYGQPRPAYPPMQQGYPAQGPGFQQPPQQSAFSFMQTPPAPVAYGNGAPAAGNFRTPPANLNISSLLDPHQVNNAHMQPGARQPNGQGININAFQGMR